MLVARAALQPDDLAALRRRAVDAATHLFAAQGYDAVTMRAVAAALGVSAMTPYRWLSGKEELFALVRAEAFRRFADHLEASLAGLADPVERLLRLKQAYVGFALDEPDAYRIMFELRQPDPDGGDAAAELGAQSRRAFGHLHDSVAAAVAAGYLDGDPLTLAHLMWASTHGLVSLHLAGKLVGRSVQQLAAIDHELGGLRRLPRRRRVARRAAKKPTRSTS
ncbi:MAG: TetR/AcrR family transcriptional regulator [Kofleriaceae bacterium]|nr:TetR/AcrR family transcriptional regulator [Myxococcales bacterium]MCB9573042.1 TetR/AcrR family transcriptional regulator [Kofleriaceae bacterium]